MSNNPHHASSRYGSSTAEWGTLIVAAVAVSSGAATAFTLFLLGLNGFITAALYRLEQSALSRPGEAAPLTFPEIVVAFVLGVILLVTLPSLIRACLGSVAALMHEARTRPRFIEDLLSSLWILVLPLIAAGAWTLRDTAFSDHAPDSVVVLLASYLKYWCGVSFFCFVNYGYDKLLAVEQGRGNRQRELRVSEASLHFWELIGGWPGGLAGRRVFNHKTARGKSEFRRRSRSMAIGHLLLTALAAFLVLR